MKLEFWISPNHEVMVTDLVSGQSQRLHAQHRSVSILYNIIKDRYPEAFKKLMFKYESRNVIEYRIIKHFICCNFYVNDHQADYDDGMLILENVPCPVKCMGCPDKDIICNPVQTLFTDREKEVLSLLKKGKSAKEIASQLHIAVDTAKNHIRHMLSKSNTHSSLMLCML